MSQINQLTFFMDAFSATPPAWTETAVHAIAFCCPRCSKDASLAQRAWINRRAPIITEDYRRKWQEFYQCDCEQVWWAWSSDRPPSQFRPSEE